MENELTQFEIDQALAEEKARERKDPLEGLELRNYPPPTPMPEWFTGELNKIGGFIDPGTNKIPRYRIVWGMDERVVQFAMGKVRMKYPSIIDNVQETIGYYVIEPGKEKQFLSVEKAKERFFDPLTQQMTRNVKRGQLIAPAIRESEIEIGSPWWIVEQWIPPEVFAETEQAWERERWIVDPENPMKYIDCNGPYPSKGGYIHWLDILDYVGEAGEQSIDYKPLDESIIEYIRANHVMNEVRRNKSKYESKEKRHQDKLTRADEIWATEESKMRREILDIKKNRVFGIPSLSSIATSIKNKFKGR